MKVPFLALLPGALALVHRARDAAEAAGATGGLIYDRLSLLRDARSTPAFPSYPCHEHPHMCREPFNCHLPNVSQRSPLAVGGHANLQFWCKAPRYADTLVKQCLVERDLRKSALEVFDMSVRGKAAELDGSYCFLEGHCSNAAIRDSSTVEDAEKVCDRRYGHAGWAGKFLLADASGAAMKIILDAIEGKGRTVVTAKGGIGEQKLTRLMSKLACAAGNFHCDVQYCKHTICQIEHYKKKYAHLVPPVPGQDIIDMSPLPI